MSDIFEIIFSMENTQFLIKQLKIVEGYHAQDFLDKINESKNITIDSAYCDFELEAIEENKKRLFSLVKITKENGLHVSPENSLGFLKNQFNVLNRSECVNYVINNIHDFSEYSIDYLHFIEELGFVFSKNKVKKIIEKSFRKKHVLEWLNKRLGSLKEYYLKKENIYYYDDKIEEKDFFGVRILSSTDFFIEESKERLLSSGKSFEPIVFDNTISLSKKLELIRFIESKIDDRFKELKLESTNLLNLEFISPFEIMKKSKLDDPEIIDLFKFKNLSNSKKSFGSLKDLISLKGQSILIKAQRISSILEKANPKIEINHSDFLDISKDGDVFESSLFSSLGSAIIIDIDENLTNNTLFFLKNKQKSHIFSFLKSCIDVEKSYFTDVVEMIASIKNGIKAIQDRIGSVDDEETKEQLVQAKDRIESRLAEILDMDNIRHIHDRLVPILSFISSDPLQPLGQDKFKKLEKNPKLEETIGNKLFFPKTREDLIYLGDNNGWCVNYHRSYGDNVIKNGNILVGICEKGTEPTRENVIALAHFLNEGRGEYQLEQLKWSSRVKNGSRNVDATRDFDHNLIKSVLCEYLDSIKDKGVK
jgi:hypothetical protein